MTTDNGGQEQQWRKVLGRDFFKAGMIVDPAIISETWWFVVDETDVMQAICVFESQADAIITDHAQAARVLELELMLDTTYEQVREAEDRAATQAAQAQRLREALENRHRYEHTPQEPTWDDHEGAGCGWCSNCLIKLDAMLEDAWRALAPSAGQEEGTK